MSFDWKINWTRVGTTNPIPIADCIKATIRKSTEIKNNICQLTVKNSPVNVADDSTIIGEYIESSTKEIKFATDDEIKVWADYLTDASEVDTEWYDDARLLGAFTLQEYQIRTVENNSHITLKAVDSAYLLFNKIYNFSYGVSNNFTSPGIVRHCARKFTEAPKGTVSTSTGTHNDTGVEYQVNAKFLSEGGYITDYRTTPSTLLDGAHNSAVTTITVDDTTGFESEGTLVIDTEHISYTGTTGTTFTGCTRAIDDTTAASHNDDATVRQGFPLILMNKVWSPLFEWIGEVSQTENTNYLSEYQEGGTKFYNRAFIFWIDKSNNPHWVYPDDSEDLTITLGEEDKRSFKLDKSIFDAVNFIIYNCGEDMYGNGVIFYLYDDTSEVSSLKMRYQPMSKIIHTLIDEDRKVNTTRDTTNQDILKQFPDSGEYPVIPSFIDDTNNFLSHLGQSTITDCDNDAEYNTALRNAAKWRGRQEAKKITTKRSGLRYKGQIALKGAHVNPGDLLKVTNPFMGLNSQYLRVTNITHNISRNTWETIVDVEEDENVEA